MIRGGWIVTLSSVAVLAAGSGSADNGERAQWGNRNIVTPAERCDRGNVRMCIIAAANRWKVSAATLLRRAYCESRMDPGAYNPSGASGLFQFMPGTWAWTPYGRAGKSVWSAKWASLGAAWMEARGLGFHWVCR